MDRQQRIGRDDDGIRLDRWFKRHFPAVSHGMLEKLLRTGQVRVDGSRVKSSDRLASGQMVRLPPIVTEGSLTERQRPAAPQMSGSLEEYVLHMDASVIVLNKPPGLATQGGSGLSKHIDGMLDSLTFERRQRPRLVHRLDRDTSGLIVAAKHAHAAYRLSGKIDKQYIAVCEGILQGSGTIDLPIRIKPGHSIQREVGAGGLPAVTHWKVLAEGNAHTLLSIHLDTGRTHQIRVHFSHIGHSLAGDDMYGGSRSLIGRQALHCAEIHFIHPVTQKTVEFTSPLPEDMRALLQNTGLSKYTI
jgi:pseudouridine synthase, RluA family